MAWSALLTTFRRADEQQALEQADRAREINEQERRLFQHDPSLWTSISERKRLVAYWLFLRCLGRMQP